jgi:uncharacterized repeat protein (TIGR01451 family)
VTTNGDAYYPAVVTLATELYAPKIVSTKTVTNLTRPGSPDQRDDVLQYTVSYTNTGSDSAANFVMRDLTPAGSTYLPGTLHIGGSQGSSNPTDALGDDAGEFNAGTGEVVFRLGLGGNGTTGGMIRPGETDTATFDVTINSEDLPGQQILNQASATFTGLTLGTSFSDTSPQVISTVSAPSLTLTKSHEGSLIGGQVATFTLAVSNVGNLGTNGSTVTVTDPFPVSSFSSLANAGGDGWSCAINVLVLTCTRSDVLPAETSYPPILVEATVQELPPETIFNTASVSGGGSAEAIASDGGGTSGVSDVSILKSADAAIVPNGETVTYTLNVQNAGPSAAQEVTVNDPIGSPSYNEVSAETTQGSCDTTVTCSLGTLAADATATIKITATVSARDTTLTNTARSRARRRTPTCRTTAPPRASPSPAPPNSRSKRQGPPIQPRAAPTASRSPSPTKDPTAPTGSSSTTRCRASSPRRKPRAAASAARCPQVPAGPSSARGRRLPRPTAPP